MITVAPVAADEKPQLLHVMAEYLAEMSAIVGGAPLASYPYLDRYWMEPDRRWPFWIRVEATAAGFALVRRNPEDDRFEMAEFFVRLAHRRRGVGSAAARAVIGLHRGDWRVTQRLANRGAMAFWDRALSGYPGYRVSPLSPDSIRREQLFSAQ